jgi:SHS family lactate transporter-like MFS transporter
MAITAEADRSVPWWREPTKDQWYAWVAGWLGWMLDAFDFTIFFLVMVAISQEFNVPLTLVAGTVTFTLWLRLVGAFASGWLCDRIGRKTPLMISILWYSVCNFAAGFAPSFAFLAFFRIILGIGMGAEWPAGAALAMESWPARSRGLMSGLLQGAWGLGFLLASLVYWLLFAYIGWRGMLWIGILPALLCVYIRFFVKESEVWEESNKNRIEKNRVAAAAAPEGQSSSVVGLVIGWLAGAVVVAVALFYILKFAGPTVLGGFVDAKLLTLLFDDKLVGVMAAGFTPFILPSLAAMIGVAIPEQMKIFRPPYLWNTFTASIWMTGQFLVYYSMIAMFASWMQRDLKFSPGEVALPNILHNAVVFFAMGFWGFVGDKIGRRLAIIIPAIIGCLIAPLYLNTTDLFWITIGFTLQGAFAGAIYGLQPAYLTERFPTEVRGTASAFCYHFGTILGGLVPPAITYLAVDRGLGFPGPMLYGTVLGAVVAVVALILSPETKGTKFTSEVTVK